MTDVTLSREVLKLNKLHQTVGFFTPKKVFGDFANWQMDRRNKFILDERGNPKRKMKAYDIDFARNADGTYDFTQLTTFNLVDWDVWVTLPIRSFDLAIRTPKLEIRVPRVVMSLLSEDMPKIKNSKSLNSVYELYDGMCQYSKVKLKKSEASRDHKIPLSRGGKDELGNIVLCHRDINSKKGNSLNEEIGLPDVIPIIPKEKFVMDILKNHKSVPEWNYFLK
jgi:5-methylcytosine-specific restriction endonuclease McrA